MADSKPKYFNIGDVPETSELRERLILPYAELNYLLNGLIFDRMTLLMAPTDSGKSSFASSLISSSIKNGYKVFLFAGEDGADEARDRLYRQFLEFDKENFVYTKYKDSNAGEFLLKHEKFEEVNKFFNNNLFIYNNEFPANKSELLSTLNQAYEQHHCMLYIIDNCEMFDFDIENENKAVKDICIELRRFAISKKVHIILVSHIKKIERNVIRINIFDNKGTSAITNVCKNIISLIRTDRLNPNTKEYKEYAKDVENAGYNLAECDAVAEVLKTKGRSLGLVGLGFNRISNSYYELKKKRGTNDDKIEDRIESGKSNLYSEQKLIPLSADEVAEVNDIFNNIF